MRKLFKTLTVLSILFLSIGQASILAAQQDPLGVVAQAIANKKSIMETVLDPAPENTALKASEKKPAESELVLISPNSDPDKTTKSQQAVTLSSSNLISLDYNNANLNDVLKAISYSYNVNIVVTKDMTGKVTAQLKDLTLDDALNAILSVNKYAFRRKGGIIYVMPMGDMELSVESIPLNFLSPKEAKDFLSKSTAKGDIQANESTSSLIVRADPSEMESIKQIIKTIDVPPIQILIEAKIVDMNKSDIETIDNAIGLIYNVSNETGIQFIKSTNTIVPSTAAPVGGGPTPILPFTDTIKGDSGGLGVTDISKKALTQFSINALVSKTKSKVLASPSIATLNGKEASIIIGERVPYTTTSITGSTSTTDVSFLDVGTKLKVTPRVSPDGWITMTIHPEVSSLIKFINGNPNVKTREATTEVRVRDNQTIIIAGLISKRDTREKNGIPFLQDLPLIGPLFTGHSKDIEEGTLTVFITPHIIPMPGSNNSKKSRTYINNSTSDHDQDTISSMIEYADSLEQEGSGDAKKKLFNSEDRIKAYRMIVEQFPQSSKMGYCLHKIALIYAKDFGRCDQAKETLMELKSTDSESSYIDVTQALVNACFALENDK